MPIALSAAVILAAVAIEATADFQLDKFLAAAGIEGSTKGVCSQGLWCESFLQRQQCSDVPDLSLLSVNDDTISTMIAPDQSGFVTTSSLVSAPELLWRVAVLARPLACWRGRVAARRLECTWAANNDCAISWC